MRRRDFFKAVFNLAVAAIIPLPKIESIDPHKSQRQLWLYKNAYQGPNIPRISPSWDRPSTDVIGQFLKLKAYAEKNCGYKVA